MSCPVSEDCCPICLDAMDAKGGVALFTAECSHIFHFQCIASSVQHGNRTCPLCMASWKQLPFEATLRPAVPRQRATNAFDDDEPLDPQPQTAATNAKVELTTFLEFPAIKRNTSVDDFSVLIHLQAPPSTLDSTRAAVDLVAVLDVSGSMAGAKLSLLKQAMGFVIQNLASHDRLSVVTFSSDAQRIFRLCRMTEAGKEMALREVNALRCSGCTNIARGLEIGARILDNRRQSNPVTSIILLSDGQDNCVLGPAQSDHSLPNGYLSLLPTSIVGGPSVQRIPVHTFGFGEEHDAALMNSIAEVSGGTFSFVEKPEMIKEAFAQCIGGLLSVVALELRVEITCMENNVGIRNITSGRYSSQLTDGKKSGSIELGDLYAYEERDFLVSINLPSGCDPEAALLSVCCGYKDPISKQSIDLQVKEVKVPRPEEVTPEDSVASAEVQRQKRRFRFTASVVSAQEAASDGRLSEAVSIIGELRGSLQMEVGNWGAAEESLDEELQAMQGMMGSRNKYLRLGMAFMSSHVSSHYAQRACGRRRERGSIASPTCAARRRTDSALVTDYQSPVMAEMVRRSLHLQSPESEPDQNPPPCP